MAGFFKKWQARLFGPKVPVVRFANGAKTIEFMGHLAKRENSLIDSWNQRGYEIVSGPVEIIINGKKEIGYAVDEAGITINFHRNIEFIPAKPLNPDNPKTFFEVDQLLIPKSGTISYNWEGIIGRCATLDDIADGLDLGKSMKNIVIGILIGLPLGWIITMGMQ